MYRYLALALLGCSSAPYQPVYQPMGTGYSAHEKELVLLFQGEEPGRVVLPEGTPPADPDVVTSKIASGLVCPTSAPGQDSNLNDRTEPCILLRARVEEYVGLGYSERQIRWWWGQRYGSKYLHN